MIILNKRVGSLWNLFKFFMIVDDSFFCLTTRMIVDDSSSKLNYHQLSCTVWPDWQIVDWHRYTEFVSPRMHQNAKLFSNESSRLFFFSGLAGSRSVYYSILINILTGYLMWWELDVFKTFSYNFQIIFRARSLEENCDQLRGTDTVMS